MIETSSTSVLSLSYMSVIAHSSDTRSVPVTFMVLNVLKLCVEN